jgi:GAF domain-containing protein
MSRGESEVEAGGAANTSRRGAKPRAKEASQRPDLERHLAEALEQQAATAEILHIIASSPADAQPVFDAIVASAVRLCHAFVGNVYRFDGDLIHFVAQHNFTPAALAITQELFPVRPHRDNATARAILDRAVVHIPDVRMDPEYRSQQWATALGIRSVLSVPMLRDGRPVGAITVSRAEAGPFSERQIALLQTFADQAVIAIDNVRRLNDLTTRNRALTEALEQQQATSEILRAISVSPTDMQRVFDMIALHSVRLCNGQFGGVFQFDGRLIHLVAQHGLTPEGVDVYFRMFPRAVGRDSAIGRALLGRTIAHIPDVRRDPEYGLAPLVEAGTMRCIVAVPMLRDGEAVGGIVAWRSEPEPFSDKQIELLQTFADQAVIAIQNVRLVNELKARNDDLSETLAQQTATSDILRVISRSPTDVLPVFDTIARSAAQLCEAEFCFVYRFTEGHLHFAAQHGLTPDGLEVIRRAWPRRPDRGSAAGRSVLNAAVEHIPDVRADPE